MKTFTKLTTNGPSPSERSTPALASLGQFAYFFGGVKDNFSTHTNTFYNDLYQFNTKTNTWQQLSPTGEMPPARGFAAAVGDKNNKQILLFGGVNYSPDFIKMDMYNDLWTYSPTKNIWTQLHPLNQGPSARSKPKIWFDNNKMYVFGGVTPTWDMLNDLWAYDLAANTWTLLIANSTPGSPPPRTEALGGTEPNNGKLTLYGGEGFNKTTNRDGTFTILNDTWEFDLKSGKWRDITPTLANNIMPPRNFACATVIDNQMFLHGGSMTGVGAVPKEDCGAPFPQRGVSDELWYFDLDNHIWKKLSACGDALPRLKRNSATTVEGKMYIFSGWDFQWYGDGPGQIWNTHVYCYDPKTNPC